MTLEQECEELAAAVRARQTANRVKAAQGPRKVRKGSAHTGAKLTEGQVENIRLWRAEGATLAMIAARYGVHKSTIQYVLGRGWKHV